MCSWLVPARAFCVKEVQKISWLRLTLAAGSLKQREGTLPECHLELLEVAGKCLAQFLVPEKPRKLQSSFLFPALRSRIAQERICTLNMVVDGVGVYSCRTKVVHFSELMMGMFLCLLALFLLLARCSKTL